MKGAAKPTTNTEKEQTIPEKEATKQTITYGNSLPYEKAKEENPRRNKIHDNEAVN
jgi:hypothetical protein